LLKLIARLARELNWARRKWSSAGDRLFHDNLYRNGNYDPFSLAYPGYTTIRRFADLVEARLPAAGRVVDFGCGPGEITCELASRRIDLRFLGIDHSSAAIARASENAARRGLTNIVFECTNVEEYSPNGAIDLATLFDSFHHLIDPQRFTTRLRPHVTRWALVEPRGSWLGTWRKDLDFDWLAQDLDKIRAHIAASIGVAATAASGTPAPMSDARTGGAAVERRYTFDDFSRFFEGLSLDLRGTVAGLEAYPPGSESGGAFREAFGEIQYRLYRDVDDWLLEHNLDLSAKHWLIVAEEGGRTRDLRSQARPVAQITPPPIAGPFDVRYGEFSGALQARVGESFRVSIQITNNGWDEWSSQADPPVFVSYHWIDERGAMVVLDGDRTPLPTVIRPAQTHLITVVGHAPTTAGSYRLAIDLVREGVTWFSKAGQPSLEIPFIAIE
jgi:SAM-dependent methyltransferase